MHSAKRASAANWNKRVPHLNRQPSQKWKSDREMQERCLRRKQPVDFQYYVHQQTSSTVGHCTLTYHQQTYTYSIIPHLVFPLHIGKVPAPFPCLGTNNNHEWSIALLWIPFWDCVSTRTIGERQKHRPGVGTLRSSFRKLHNSGTLWNQWPVALFWWFDGGGTAWKNVSEIMKVPPK